MRKIRSIATQSPAIAISILALVFSLGSGAGYAATHYNTTPKAPKITWHKLPLIHGWHSGATVAPGIPATNNPGYTISNNVVYLTGSLASSSASPEVTSFAVLPKGFRPSRFIAFAAGGPSDTLTGTTILCEVLIDANGTMFSHCPSDIWGGADGSYTSLNGISFPLGS
jgi:hypothetical protein